MLRVLLPLLVLAALAALVAWLKQKVGAQQEQVLPYSKGEGLFSEAERSFLGVLDEVLGNNYRVMGKVRLADLVDVQRGLDKSQWQKAFNRIQSKHVDFVICDRQTLTPQFIVELDDQTHARSDRHTRDQFVDQVLTTAGLKVLRFTAKRTYSPQEVWTTLFGNPETTTG